MDVLRGKFGLPELARTVNAVRIMTPVDDDQPSFRALDTMTGDLIYDVGMHNGNDTAYYLACGYRVVAVEADPVLAADGAKRFKAEIEAGRLTILNVGVAENAKTAEFWINEAWSHLNSFNRESAARLGDPHHSILISCRRLDSILAEHGVPYYLKIDIEGHDIICCDQIARDNKPKYISVEMSRIELLHKLQELGYNRFKLISQHDLQAIDVAGAPFLVRCLRLIYRFANHSATNGNLSRRMGQVVAAKVLHGARALARSLGLTPWGAFTFRSPRLPEWKFVEGCSGAFGEDLPGAWLTAEEINSIWQRELKEYEMMGREVWCDLHATTSTEKS